MKRAVDILLVEDSVGDAELAVAALKARSLGDKMVHFVDGDEVLDFICANSWSANWKAESAPRLILLDLNLTRMGGLEVLQQLKVRDQTRPIPVVVFTGSHDEKEMLESYRLGANSYVVKPADAKRYAQLVGDIAYYWLMVNHSFH
ncbi:MAG: two-component system response regulator [Pedosphaera sp.]|nr:two-component system response regulator [Pedosphaera sp.]